MQSITSFKLALVSTAVFGALAASPAFAADKVIKLGFSAPLTGPQAHYGEDMRNGLVLALEDDAPRGPDTDERAVLVTDILNPFSLLLKMP